MITKIHIKNFKGIRDIELDNIREFNVLIGKNGSGKTTLLYCIDFIKRLASGRNISSALKSLPFSHLQNMKSDDKDTIIDVTFITQNNKCFKLFFQLSSITNEDKTNNIIFEKESLHHLIKDREEEIYTRTGNKIIVKGESLNINLEINKLALPIVPIETSSEIAKFLSSYKYIDIDTNKIHVPWQPVPVPNNEKTLDEIAATLYKNDIESFKLAIKIIGEVLSNFSPPEIVNISDFFKKQNDESRKDQKKFDNFFVFWNEKKLLSMSSQSLSGGNARIIYIILSLFSAKKNSCIGIEEIENGLHMGRIEKLMDQLKTLIKNRGLQLFITTHSAQMLEQVLPHDVIFSTYSYEDGSKYQYITSTKAYGIIEESLEKTPSTKDLIDSGFYN
jgi:predicted ATPase